MGAASATAARPDRRIVEARIFVLVKVSVGSETEEQVVYRTIRLRKRGCYEHLYPCGDGTRVRVPMMRRFTMATRFDIAILLTCSLHIIGPAYCAIASGRHDVCYPPARRPYGSHFILHPNRTGYTKIPSSLVAESGCNYIVDAT